jgi:AbrB family looped-hinge helix DNA binding protein
VLTRLSSKGQLIIPKAIRQALKLQPGTEFQITLSEGKILLEPVAPLPIEALHGKYADSDFLADLETEHQQEIEHDQAICP